MCPLVLDASAQWLVLATQCICCIDCQQCMFGRGMVWQGHTSHAHKSLMRAEEQRLQQAKLPTTPQVQLCKVASPGKTPTCCTHNAASIKQHTQHIINIVCCGAFRCGPSGQSCHRARGPATEFTKYMSIIRRQLITGQHFYNSQASCIHTCKAAI